MKYLLIAASMLMLSCKKQDGGVLLTIQDNNGAVYYTFTSNGAYYTPEDTTHVIISKGGKVYEFSLPSNEPTGYYNPASYDSAVNKVFIISAKNPKIFLRY
jgi:hypothetical protein